MTLVNSMLCYNISQFMGIFPGIIQHANAVVRSRILPENEVRS